MASRVRYEVEHCDPRGENPGQKLDTQIVLGGKQGKRLVSVISLFDEHLLIWELPSAREQRG